MITLLTEMAPMIATAGVDGDSPWLLLLIGPAGGAAVYWGLYRYYRNTDKSHQFERDTLVQARPISGDDTKVDEIRGTRKSRISGDNVSAYRTRVRRVR